MWLDKPYLRKFLHEAAVQEVKDKYERLGYKVKKEVLVGDYRADLLAKKGKQEIYFEFKVGDIDRNRADQILRIRRVVQERSPEAEFRLVNINPPKKARIELDGVEQIILAQLADNIPDEVECLSTHSSVEEVSGVEFDSVLIGDNRIVCSGSFIVTIGLQYGSDGDVRRDDGFRGSESFPATFELGLTGNLEVEHFKSVVDTSSWSE